MNEGGRHRTRGGPGNGSTTFRNSEELGTKDDERKPGKLSSWTLFWRKGVKMRRRRLLLTVLVLLLLWAFTYYRLPTPQWISQAPPGPARPGFRGTGSTSKDDWSWAAGYPPSPEGLPPQTNKGKAANGEFYYDGEVIFYKLPSSLHAISKTFGHRANNRNVLFAASSLKSAAVLIPFACDMAKIAKNHVHMAIMSRSDLSLEEILEINGVDKTECKMYWHDARPDYAAYSTESRAGAAISAALSHIKSFMHPQAIITDDSISEDAFFVRALSDRASVYNIPIIELPADSTERLAWIARLDSTALAAWHRPTVDILIQAQPDSSGALMRLLTSLYGADYSGLLLPRLTIELPHEVDSVTQMFLSNFRWPPPWYSGSVARLNQLSIRRRIPSQKISAEEASIRFFESFYPANPSDSHVLLLSPRAQLSPLYFHYLIYHLLEYHYSTYNPIAAHLIGFSLETPPTHLNGTSAFEPPQRDLMSSSHLKRASPASDDFMPSFLWQAPNSNAALYFGSKWVEIHDFMSNRLRCFHNPASTALQRPKLVSSEYPSWTEYFLEFMRARGYALLYPGRADSANEALVSIHNELYQPPEEFLKPLDPPANASSTPSSPDETTDPPPDAPPINTAEPFTAPTDTPSPHHSESTLATSSRPLTALLPFLETPDIHALPFLSYNGNPLSLKESISDADAYADTFRLELGGCSTPRIDGRKRRYRPGSARDLFCWGDDWDWDFEPAVEPVKPRGGYGLPKEFGGHGNPGGGKERREEAEAGVEKLLEEGRVAEALVAGSGGGGSILDE